jgi:PKD repeat protein
LFRYITIILIFCLVGLVGAIDIQDGTTTKTPISEASLSSGITEFTDVKSDLTVTTSIKIDGVDFVPSTSEKSGEQLVWSTATKDVIISYSYDGISLKENIVLKEDKQLSFPINISSNARIIPWYNKQWKIVDKNNGNTIKGLILEKPFGIDSNGNRIEMEYKYKNGILILEYNRTVVTYKYPVKTVGLFPTEEEIQIIYSNITYPLIIDPTWTAVLDHYEAEIGNETLIMWNSTGNSTWTTPNGVTTIQFLIVGGGGAGNGNGDLGNSGSGGNGGSTKSSSSYAVTGGVTYNITVGSGGVGVANAAGGNGTNSSFDTQTITGGWGGHEQQGPSAPAGGDGAGAAHSGQIGGAGNQSNITDTLTYYGGGGGSGYTSGGAGGSGGGGRGEDYNLGNAAVGTDGFGGGGGGVSNAGSIAGRSGGSGVVIIRYTNPYNISVNFTADKTTTFAGDVITFTDYTNTAGYVMTAWNWSFGDGGTSTVHNATHTYTTVGVYNVTFSMWNNTTGNISKTRYNYITVDFNWTWDAIATGYYTTYGGYKLYKWNTTGNHNWTAPPTANSIEYLVVAGGGGGTCGGGGAGGYLSNATFNVTNGTIYNITVGSGGSGGVATAVSGGNGTNSSFHNITAIGGGGGGRQESGPIDGSNYGMPGGSGGGAGASGSTNLSGGSGVSGQGYYGGATTQVGAPYPAGGGGGASQQGGGGTVIGGGYGGNGTYNNITFIGMYYAGGGGGDGSSVGAGVGGTGGLGGGGNGGDNTVGGTAGINGTGGGGGGAAGAQTGGAGGSGIVVIKYYAPVIPVANFTSDNTTACMYQIVQFNDTSTNTPTSWSWLFGDGVGNSTLQNPNYTYTTAGVYNVSLYASNAAGGNYSNKTGYITINNCTPVANFTADNTTSCINVNVQFTDTSTNTPTSWNWSFGDTSTNITQNPLHTFTTGGNFTVSLNVSNVYGNSSITKTDYIHTTSCTPPQSIGNLSGVVTGCGAALWNWTDPSDGNLDHIMVYINNVFETNVTVGVQSYDISGKTYGNYTISTQTANINGNTNTTWVNNTVSGVITCPPGSGGSGGVYGDTDILPIVFVVGGVLLCLAVYLGGKND